LVWPVFIGEVAYKEKNIAMSYTKKEVISSTINGFLSLKAFKFRNKDNKLVKTNKDFLFKR